MVRNSSIHNKYGIHEGDTVNTNNFGCVLVLSIARADNVKIKFLNSGNIRHCRLVDLSRGAVADKIYSKGVKGISATKDSNGKILRSYDTWRAMIRRSSPYWIEGHPTYAGVTISDEWCCYDTFLPWYNDMYPGYGEELDKDLLFVGNKHYSPQTCCFIPEDINKFLAGETFKGYCLKGKKYESYFKGKYLGSSDDIYCAQQLYVDARNKYAEELSYLHFQDTRISEALSRIRYSVVDGLVRRVR